MSQLHGTTIGCDFAGIVEDVGTLVSKDWNRGDGILGFTHGGNETQAGDGCSAQYCAVKDGLGMEVHLTSIHAEHPSSCPRIPDFLPDEIACTFGVSISTIGQGLYQSLDLPSPLSDAEAHFPTLIYGGSTATSSVAIQFPRLSGCTVITIYAPRNFVLFKDRGAHAVLDHADPVCVAKLQQFTGGRLAHAFDCISTPDSAKICSEAMGTSGGIVLYLLPTMHDREDVQTNYTSAYTAMGEYFRVNGREFEAGMQDLEFTKTFWKLSERLIENGQVKAHPTRMGYGGLKGLFDGLQSMREGRVSGEKLVYQIQ